MTINGIPADEVMRMADAIAVGMDADREFRLACGLANIDPKIALDAPLLVLGMSLMRPKGSA